MQPKRRLPTASRPQSFPQVRLFRPSHYSLASMNAASVSSAGAPPNADLQPGPRVPESSVAISLAGSWFADPAR